MSNQTPTPDTDAEEFYANADGGERIEVVDPGFARRLERERDEARRELDLSLKDQCQKEDLVLKYMGDVDEARAEVARLADWKAQQMQVEASWDAQSVADELGLPLGVSIRPEILPRIKALKAEVARLREALERIAKGGWQSHGRRIARNTLAAVRGETTKEEAK
jgi:hypothetical protein